MTSDENNYCFFLIEANQSECDIVTPLTLPLYRDEVEGSGAEDEEFDENAAINEAVNKVTELVSNWADNIGDVDMNLEINHEENEISHEKIKKKKCEKCVKKGFRVRNLDLCSRCEEEQQEEQEVTTAMTTPKQNDRKIER